nr:UDP-N-acetylmuramoyl-L-alanyl-D-glutamate--2,6-diaminopimelate ligase [Ardenticatena sp.]
MTNDAMHLLHTLLSALPYAETTQTLPKTPVSHITADSRAVVPGSIFVAYRGVSVDGHRFIGDAVARGAIAVLGEAPPEQVEPLPVPYVHVRDGREALAWLAAAWHGHPSRAMRVVGITGTDGKTTTTTLVGSVLRAAGEHVGLLTTIGATIGGQHFETAPHTTTPDALELQHYLRHMVEAGVTTAVLEVTSHGLAQHRVTGIAFDTAIVTNITHEHLDFHGTLENYRRAKAMLFEHLMNTPRKRNTPKVSILNADDSSFAYLRPIPAERSLTYGIEQPADVRAEQVRYDNSGTTIQVDSPLGVFEVRTHLLGPFNVYNVLAAVAAGIAHGADIPAIQAGIAAVQRVKGRMEPVDMGQPFLVLIDFAHTPISLEQALTAARAMTNGRIIVVFGSAGLRDRAKRGMMGRIAARLADLAVLTAEDPRTEDVNDIIAEIAAGAAAEGAQEGRDYVRIPDRTEAIAYAIAQAQPGDIVLTCGKGHEPTMCYGTTEYPWSEHDAVRNALQRLGFTANQQAP